MLAGSALIGCAESGGNSRKLAIFTLRMFRRWFIAQVHRPFVVVAVGGPKIFTARRRRGSSVESRQEVQ
jgi:hypothetical protein